MRQIAIYGKGGIGKSTLVDALAVALARAGRTCRCLGADPEGPQPPAQLVGVEPAAEGLDQQIAASPMRVPGAMRSAGRDVFGDGALSKKHKELTALTVAVATNCWE